MKYQHNVYHVRANQGPVGLCQALDQLSSEGWEAIAIQRILIATGSQIALPGQTNPAGGEPGWEVVARRRVEEAPCTCEREEKV